MTDHIAPDIDRLQLSAELWGLATRYTLEATMAEMPREQHQEHFGAAPGEQVYDAVPIPGAYQPMSPTHTGGFQR